MTKSFYELLGILRLLLGIADEAVEGQDGIVLAVPLYAGIALEQDGTALSL